MKIKALLIDDEESSRNVLKTLLEKFCPEIELIGQAGNVDSAYRAIIELQPNLVFLDVQMPGENGFGLLSKFQEIPFQVIFVTGFDQYALTAIKFSALDYLLKPVEVDDLVNAVNKARVRLNTPLNSGAQIQNLLDNEGEEIIHKRISVHDKGKVRFIKLNEIVFMEADGNYTQFYLSGGEKYSSPKSLKEYEELFDQVPLFLRINKSVIVSLNFIKEYSKKEPFSISLLDGKEFEISRRKKHEVNERLKSLK